MAYDDLNNNELAQAALDHMNKAENHMQAAMRRQNELIRRGCECGPGDEHPEHPIPPTGGDVFAKDVPRIPSNFDTSKWLAPAGMHAERDPTEGAFRMTGNVAQYGRFDPLVFPAQEDAGHLHEWIGNTAMSAHSDYQSMRVSGNGTTEGSPINRSAYWQPPLLLGDMILVPIWNAIYYKRAPKVPGPNVIPRGATIAPLPRGLRMITKNEVYNFEGFPETSDMVEALSHVVPGSGKVFIAGLTFPDLWDGLRVDSADHMAHMAWPIWNQNGYWEAPPTHPFLVPRITVKRAYMPLAGEDWTKVESAADRHMGTAQGVSKHGDYWEGWDDYVFTEIERWALDLGLNCSGGDIGNGQLLIRPPSFTFDQTPHRIPLAEVPVHLIV